MKTLTFLKNLRCTFGRLIYMGRPVKLRGNLVMEALTRSATWQWAPHLIESALVGS
jgi:hypothetical protein